MRYFRPFYVLCGFLVVTGLLWAGQLSPPSGPVAPTMKSLDDLSAEHAAILAAIGGGSGGAGGGVKRVIHGLLDFPAGTYTVSQAISPAINPAKAQVVLDPSVYINVSSATYTAARTGGCVTELTAEQITVMIDNTSNFTRKVSYQIIEYN